MGAERQTLEKDLMQAGWDCPVRLYKLCTAQGLQLKRGEQGLKFWSELCPPSPVPWHEAIPALKRQVFP